MTEIAAAWTALAVVERIQRRAFAQLASAGALDTPCTVRRRAHLMSDQISDLISDLSDSRSDIISDIRSDIRYDIRYDTRSNIRSGIRSDIGTAIGSDFIQCYQI